MTALAHFATALAIGLLLGLEREHSTAEEPFRPAGSRTFPLLAVTGAISAAVGPAVLIAALTVTSLLVVAWYVLAVRSSTEAEAGATTEVAAIVTVLLGGLTWNHPTWAVPIAVAVVALLAAKRPLHHFAIRLVTDADIADAVRLFVVAFVIYPLLPDRPMGPYGALNPSQIWLLVIAIVVIGWAGYVAARALGESQGLLVVGFLGGFISASATTLVLARKSVRGVPSTVLPAVLAASVATLVQLIAVTAVANPSVALQLLPAAIAGALTLTAETAGLAWWVRRSEHTAQRGEPAHQDAGTEAPVELEAAGFHRPLALRTALSLALLLVLLLLATRAAADLLGDRGVLVTAFVGGLPDAHAASVAAATMAGSTVPTRVAVLAVATALLSNTLVKLVLAAAAGGLRLALELGALLVLPALAVTIGIAFTT